MKKACLLSLMLCAGVFAQNNTIMRWRGLEGVITAPGTDNPVSQIHSGAGPWTARGGSVRINLSTGEGSFDVDGLVLNGGTSSGTPGGVTSVMGTLVCNPGGAAGPEAVLDTALTPLNADGNADLSFRLNVPVSCNKPVFLIRTAGGKWIATATLPSSGPQFGY